MRKSGGNVEKSWDGQWPRYDPNRGYMLCEHCWNNQHWIPAYFDKMGTRHPRQKNCLEGGCRCGCIHELPRPKPKFVNEGQTAIPMNNPITIEKGSR